MKLYTVYEAARIAGISYNTLYRWIRSGRVYPVEVNGKLYIPSTAVAKLQQLRYSRSTVVCNSCGYVFKRRSSSKPRCPQCRRNPAQLPSKADKQQLLQQSTRIERIEQRYIKLWEDIKAAIAALRGKPVNVGDVVPTEIFNNAATIVTQKVNFANTTEAYILRKIFKCYEPVVEVDAEKLKPYLVGYKILR